MFSRLKAFMANCDLILNYHLRGWCGTNMARCGCKMKNHWQQNFATICRPLLVQEEAWFERLT